MNSDSNSDSGHGRRRVLVAAGVAAGAVLVGAVLGLLLAGGSSRPSRSALVAKLPALTPGVVVAAPDASPDALDEPVGMGSLHAGVALVGAAGVREVRTPDGRRRAPAGSRLLAFRLADWTCEVQPCGGWRTLLPRVVVDGQSAPIPEEGDTFVLVVPPGAVDADVVVDADGHTQSISLVDRDAGPDNVLLLATPDRERRVPLGQTFRLAESTSIPLDDGAGGQTTAFEREVGVDYAQLRFFLHGAEPSSPRNAFLAVNAWYSYVGQQGRYVLGPGEVRFVDADGTGYDARDLDPAPAKGLLGFEVPATVRSGTLVVGGSTDKVSTTGVPYVSQLQELRVPISLG